MAVAFDAVATGGGTTTTTSPVTWAHINSAAGNAIVVGMNYESGTTPEATAVSYGGVALSRLGTVPGNNAGPGGIDLWGKIGGLPTGSNTVSATLTGLGGNALTGGSMSFTGATSFGTAFTGFATGTSVTTNVTGTTSGGMIAAVASFGNSSFSFTATSGTLKYSVIGDSNSGADNTGGGIWTSPGGTQAVGFSTSGTGDFWGLVAVELIPSGGGAASPAASARAEPGKTWCRRYHRRAVIPGIPAAGNTFNADTSLTVTATITADSSAGAGSWQAFRGSASPRPRGAAGTGIIRQFEKRGRYFQVPVTPASGNTFSADASLTVTTTVTADSSALAGSWQTFTDQSGSRPRWAALLRNKTRRTRYWTVPTTGLNTADTSLTVTAGITADSVRIVSVDTSATVTNTITAAATAGGGSTQQIIYRPAPRPRWAALLRTKQLRKRQWTVPTTGLQTIDANVSVTAGITADSSAGGASTRQVMKQAGSRPHWAALLRTKQRRNRYFTLQFPAATNSIDASLTVTNTVTAAAVNNAVASASATVTAGITAAVTETATANTSLTVTAGITAAVSLTQHADASLAVTDTITAAATGTLRASASLTVTMGITAAASVGVATNPTTVTAGITAAASNVTSDGANASVTAGITANAVNVTTDGASLAVSAGITANAQAIYRTAASVTVTSGISADASMLGLISAAPVAISAAVTAAADIPSIINKTIAIKWNTEALNAPSSTLLATHWKSMINDTRGMTKDGTKYAINDTRGMTKDGVKYMTNGGYK